MIRRLTHALITGSLLLILWHPISAAPIAGSDFSTAAVFDQNGGSYDIALSGTDDIDSTDNVTVTNWVFGGTGKFQNFDGNAQVSMPSDQVTKIDGNSMTQPALGTLPAGMAYVSFSINIPAGTTVDLSSVTWPWRKATGSGNVRWLAFRTSLDANLTFSEIGLARPAVQNANIDLSGATYQGLTDTTVTFYWYAGGQGSGDIDFDTPVVHGTVSEAADNPPTVVNSAVADLSPTLATLGGDVTDTGGANPDVIIYWGDNDAGTTAGNWDNSIDLGKQGGAFTSGISGLTPSTFYFFRCFASNSAGDDWADSTATFSTGAPPNPPTIVNNAATGIGFIEADLNGTVTATGGETPNVTLFYGDNDGGTNPGSWDSGVSLGAQSGAFTTDLFGLTHDTTYYFRAFAENSGGSSWASSTANFTTNAFSPPTVTNVAASNVTGAAAVIGGSVTSTGGDPPDLTIYWGDNDAGTTTGSWDNSVTLGEQSSDFSSIISGLSSLTTYYFRAFAQNAADSAWAGSTESFTTLEVSELIMTEFMAANDAGQSNNPNGWYPIANQVPGTSDDWIEIHNTSTSLLELDNWHLTDDATNLIKWTFPENTDIVAGGYLIVYASGNDTPDANGNLHTNFKLSAGGEYLALVRPGGGGVTSEFGIGAADYPSQDDDISYGLHPNTSEPVYFSSPTPGSANDSGGIARVGDTSFSPDRGYYQSAIDVTITSITPGATIYYTTDGTKPVDISGNPTGTATAYTGPVPITQTTPLRAAATKAGFAPTNIDSQTYILLDIDNANPNGTDTAGLNTQFLQQTQPAGWGNLTSGDYNMDTTVSQATATATDHPTSTAQTMLLGLRDIPTISIAMNRADFSGNNGIYTNSTNGSLEHECSAEFIPATVDTRSDWQINCGIKVQGGASRNPSSSPKHSMNFRFRTEYGAGRLRQPLFPGSEVEEFNSITLRAGYNNSWIHRDAGQRGRGSMIRDQWMRESMLDMGSPAAGHGFMVHVFVNGLYWGVHNLCERPEASHYAAYNGGDDSMLDARNGGSFVDGSSTAWNAISGVVSSGDWSKIQQVIDIDQYIDYQIINRYGGNADLKSGGNWRAAGGGPFPGGQPEQMAPWQLYSWDGERSLEGQNASNSPIDPMGLRGTLESNPDYRARFADRLQKHFFNGGALTPEATKARWMKFANNLDRSIIAESARWGDHRGTLYTRDNQWLAEQNRLRNVYFPVRSANVLSNYGSLFPGTDAPEFFVNGVSQNGGIIPDSGSLHLAASPGTIHYTTDGADPRLEGGSVNPTASSATSGVPISLTSSSFVRARTLNGGVWSPITEAQFILAPIADASNIVISEIMYNPAGSSEDSEWVELMNISTDTIDLTDLSFTGIDYTFPLGTTLAAGQRIVVVKNQITFGVSYLTAGMNIAPGEFASTSLDNTGEQIALIDATGTDAQRFTYNDKSPWPTAPDGDGYSLVLIAPGTSPNHTIPAHWRSSRLPGGSPSGTDATPFTGDPDLDNDGDGLSAFLEHALGSINGDAENSPESYMTVGSGSFDNGAGGNDEYLTMTFRRNLGADDVLFSVQVSPNLSAWTSLGTQYVSSVSNNDGTENVTYRSTTELDSVPREFIRLRVSERP